jgi:hypothetical protein
MEKTAQLSARAEDKLSLTLGPQTEGPVHSARSSAASVGSARSVKTARSAQSMDTFRTSMSTARVHTVLAALSAEKQALLSKLRTIDAALEQSKEKKNKSRTGK